jgi:predicted phage terminase large subunit-like protein
MKNSMLSMPLFDPFRMRKLLNTLRMPALARRDPNAFVPFCFTDSTGRPIRQARVHAELQRFLDLHPKALIELPRDHGKSFQVCCRLVWELGRDPSLRVKIVCATGAIATERVRFIRDAIANNVRVRRVFPKLVPGPQWSANAFTVERPAECIGPSVSGYGLGSGSTGTRADLLVCDDVVDVRSVFGAAERVRAAEYFENNLMNLLEPEGRCWGLFTPWHPDDLNMRLKKKASFRIFRRAIGPNFEPVWPERWSADKLISRRDEIGSTSFTRGYRLLPVSEEETPIRPEWIRFWSETAKYERIVLSIDPAVRASAKADASAVVVLGHVPPMIHVLEATARRVAAPELVSLIDDFDTRWNPDVVLFETNAAFLGIKDLLVHHARFGPRIKGVTQTRDKASRIAALSIGIENGSVRLKGAGSAVDPGQRMLLDEMLSFPFGEHDDLADALATGVAYLLQRREPRVW